MQTASSQSSMPRPSVSQTSTARAPRALIVATTHTMFGAPDVQPTGLWLSELTHFYDVFEQAGIAMDIVTLTGGAVPVDARSLGWPVLDKATKARYEDPAFMALLENTLAVQSVDWRAYDVLYIAGGHGAMWDLAESEELQELTRAMFEDGRIVAAVCHGVAALQNVTLSDGAPLIQGRRGTGFPYFDETVSGVKKHVPYNLERRLKDRGMRYSKAFLPLAGHVVVDGRLITGQNPNSALKAAQRTLSVLRDGQNA